MSDYITLATDTGSPEKRFYAVEGSRKWERAEEREKLSSGRPAITRGRSNQVYSFKLLVPQAVSDSNWGTLEDLEQFYGYDNPNGSPSDLLTLTLQDGSVRQVKIIGDTEPTPETPALTGIGSFWAVGVEFLDLTQSMAQFSQAPASMYVAAV